MVQFRFAEKCHSILFTMINRRPLPHFLEVVCIWRISQFNLLGIEKNICIKILQTNTVWVVYDVQIEYFYFNNMFFPEILVDKKQKVSFMTTLDRELFPVKMPPNRFGNEIVPLRGAPHRGPGCYENEDV